MRSTTYYCNLLLVFVILIISLLLVVDTTLASHQTQTKWFWNNGYGRARTLPNDTHRWQWYLTETDGTWYNFHVWGKGWLSEWPSYYLNSETWSEGWWGTTSGVIALYEANGLWTNGRHRATLHHSNRRQSSASK
jgi:hypothetical protein